MRIVLLPGLGADGRLFAPQLSKLAAVDVVELIEPLPGETLPDYATRLAGSIDWAPGDILGGASFGGMVAFEMARTLHPESVLLIGSAGSGREVAACLRALAPLARFISLGKLRRVRMLGRLLGRLLGATRKDHLDLFADMLSHSDGSLSKWAPGAILKWSPEPLVGTRVLRVHGAKDWIIPPPARVDLLVAGAGHLVNLTHPDEVNGFIERAMNS